MADKKWSTEATGAGTYKFNTAGTFVDRDIELTIPEATTDDMSVYFSVPSANIEADGFTPEPSSVTPYKVSLTTTKGTGYATLTTTGAGWIGADTISGEQDFNVMHQVEQLYVPEANISTSSTVVSPGSVGFGITSGGIQTYDENSPAGDRFNIVAFPNKVDMGKVTAVVKNGEVAGMVAANEDLSFTIDTPVNPEPAVVKWINKSNLTTSTADSIPTGASTVITPDANRVSVVKVNEGYVNQSADMSVYVKPLADSTKAIIINSVTQVSGTDVERGILKSANTGVVTQNQELIAPATFSNSGVSGKQYINISDTPVAPVLVSGSGLYINRGFVDDLYISLKKLSPDEASGATAIQHGMLEGISAYDNDGNLVTGDIATKTDSDLELIWDTFKVPSGYYDSEYSVTMEKAEGSSGLRFTSLDMTPKPIIVDGGEGVVIGGKKLPITPTTTKPENGYYVSIKTDAQIVTNYTNVSLTKQGYIGYTEAGTMGYSAFHAGAQASDMTYIPISAGAITNNTSGGTSTATISAGSQIKIGKGYYPEDLYYTAQDAGSTTKAEYTLGGTASGFTASSSMTNFYVTPSRTVTSAGYLDSSVNPTTTTRIYIPTTTINSTTAVTISDTSYTKPEWSTTPPTGKKYITISNTAKGNGTGIVTTTTFGGDTHYIQVYEGSYSIT